MKVAILVAMVLAYVSAMNIPASLLNHKFPSALDQVLQYKSIIAQLEQVAQEIGNFSKTVSVNKKSELVASHLDPKLIALKAQKAELEDRLERFVFNSSDAFKGTFFESFVKVNDVERMRFLNMIINKNLEIAKSRKLLKSSSKMQDKDYYQNQIQNQTEELNKLVENFKSFDSIYDVNRKLIFDLFLLGMLSDEKELPFKLLDLLNVIDKTEESLFTASTIEDANALKVALTKTKIEFVSTMLEKEPLIKKSVELRKEVQEFTQSYNELMSQERENFFDGVVKFKDQLEVSPADKVSIERYMKAITDLTDSMNEPFLSGERFVLMKQRIKDLSIKVQEFDNWLSEKRITKEIISELKTKAAAANQPPKVETNPVIGQTPVVTPAPVITKTVPTPVVTIDPKLESTQGVQTAVVTPDSTPDSQNLPPKTENTNTNDNTTTNVIDPAKQEAWYKNPWAVGGGSAVAVGATVFGVSELAKKNGEGAQSAETTPETVVAE